MNPINTELPCSATRAGWYRTLELGCPGLPWSTLGWGAAITLLLASLAWQLLVGKAAHPTAQTAWREALSSPRSRSEQESE